METQIQTAFLSMTEDADPGRVEKAVLARIHGKSRRRYGIPVKRMVQLAAAAMAVLVLTVTVYAAVQKYLWVEIPEDGPYNYMVRVENDAGETVQLSDDILAELETILMTREDMRNGNWKGMTFDTWQDAAEFLDCGLLTSDLLTESDTEWGQVTLYAYADEDGEPGAVETVSLSGACYVRDSTVGCLITVNIPLAGWGDQYDMMVSYGIGDPDGDETTEHIRADGDTAVTEYTTPSGIPIEIVDVTTMSNKNGVQGTAMVRAASTSMHLCHDGILYQILFDSLEDGSSAAELAKTIADSLK